MNRWIATAALLLLVAAPAAIAQTGQTGMGQTAPGAGTAIPIPSAPVGHRQPRRGDVPSEKNIDNPNDPIAREDAALDRKLKSICRGC